MDQNVCESCFPVVWRLCWSCCSCLCTSFWCTNVGWFSYLCFLFSISFWVLWFQLESCSLPLQWTGETQCVGIVLLSSSFLPQIQRIIHPLCRPTDAAERKGSALVTQISDVAISTGLQMGYLRGIAAGAAYLQDCTAVIPFSRKWRCCSVKCKHTKLPPGFEEERIGLFIECVLLLCIVSLGSFLAASSPLLIWYSWKYIELPQVASAVHAGFRNLGTR